MRRLIYAAVALLVTSGVVQAVQDLQIGTPRNETQNWQFTDENFDKVQDQGIFIQISNLSVNTSSFAVAPYACKIVSWYSVIDGDVPTQTTLQLSVGTTDIGMGGAGKDESNIITIAAASVAGDIDSFTGVSKNNTVSAGSLIAVESRGETSSTPGATITVVCRR